MINQPEEYKVRNDEGKYLSFNFNASTGAMEPLWAGIMMSYPFSFEEAHRLANIHESEVMSPDEWQLEYEKFREECKQRSIQRMVREVNAKGGVRR